MLPPGEPQALGSDFGTAPHALPVGAVLNSRQRSLYGSDLTPDKRGLPFERNVIFHLDRCSEECLTFQPLLIDQLFC